MKAVPSRAEAGHRYVREVTGNKSYESTCSLKKKVAQLMEGAGFGPSLPCTTATCGKSLNCLVPWFPHL